MPFQFTGIYIVLLQNIRCLTSCGWGYSSLGHLYTKEFWLLVCKTLNLKSLYKITLNFIHKYWSIGSPDYVNIETVFNNF